MTSKVLLLKMLMSVLNISKERLLKDLVRLQTLMKIFRLNMYKTLSFFHQKKQQKLLKGFKILRRHIMISRVLILRTPT